jgi:hypothetical protein
MRQVMKIILLAGAVVFGLLSPVWAFVPAGPVGNGGDAWQSPAIGYFGINAPKNIGEEYRRNTPVMYYAYDANFLGFFGSNGIVAVDSAFAILNSAFTNNPTGVTKGLDGYSTSLAEFPLDSRNVNYQAQALGMLDLKTETLGLMVEQLGLTDPISYIWTLHDRYHVDGPACPANMEYLVVQRNLDIVSSPLNQMQYSPYVNDTLYSYQILEACTGAPLAMTEPFAVDPLADTYSPVASFMVGLGDFYSGLTRDDMAGLRYLMQATNVNWETASPDSLLYSITTNTDSIAMEYFPVTVNLTNTATTNYTWYYYYLGVTNGIWGYGDLAMFLSYAATNDPVTLQADFPGVVISSSSKYSAYATNVTYSYYYTNPPYGSPVGSGLILKAVTNYTVVPIWKYNYQFANVITNHSYKGKILTYNVSMAPPIGSPVGTAPATKVTITTNYQTAGDFFVLPMFNFGSFQLGKVSLTNVCPLDLGACVMTNVEVATNYITTAFTNLPVASNTVSTTSISNTQYVVTCFTNYQYIIYPVNCATIANATGLYQGIEKIRFVRADYDSLLGQYWQPVTNNYTMVYMTNSQYYVQHFQRVVTVPDFLFSAQDQATGPGEVPIVPFGSRNLNFDQANVLPGLAGPGTITTPTTITYDKVGPVYFNNSIFAAMDGSPYFNQTPGGIDTNEYYLEYFVWASYDGTTNAPVVYPNGTSLDNLGNMLQVQAFPAQLTNGVAGRAYAATFTATGGSFTPPYTWSVTELPDGLNLSGDGQLSGTPTVPGNYVFTLILTDDVGRSVQWNYSLTIQ